jgi:peptide/nickel transport system substrate-binding protein
VLSKQNSRYNRRQFIRLVSLVGGGAVLAACAGRQPGLTPATEQGGATRTANSPSTVESIVAEPRRGGKLRFATTRVPDGAFDPALAIGQTLTFSHWVYEALVDVAEDYVTPIARLAESWHAEEGARAWVFNLRQGVSFHHGREFVAQDVLHTFGRILDPSSAPRDWPSTAISATSAPSTSTPFASR